MPKELAKFLQLIKDQLFFNTGGMVVVLDELVWTKRDLSKFDIQQGIQFLKDKGVAKRMKVHTVWRHMGTPANDEDRAKMINAPAIKIWARQFFLRNDPLKKQIALELNDGFDEFYREQTGQKKNPHVVPAALPSSKPELGFDLDKSVLRLNGEQILISKRSDKTDGHYVLEYIFYKAPYGIGSPSDYTEILKDQFTGHAGKWRKCLRACEDVQDKVFKHTQGKIPDFLTFSTGGTGAVQITPKYIPK